MQDVKQLKRRTQLKIKEGTILFIVTGDTGLYSSGKFVEEIFFKNPCVMQRSQWALPSVALKLPRQICAALPSASIKSYLLNALPPLFTLFGVLLKSFSSSPGPPALRRNRQCTDFPHSSLALTKWTHGKRGLRWLFVV